MSLAEITRFRVPGEVVRRTEEALRDAGAQGYELFVLWSGQRNGEAFDVRTPHVPKQTSYRLTEGLCVRVEGDELHRLNLWLYDASQMLGAQVHAHPQRAYHSDTDNAYPIMATLGGLSIVAPDFCRGGLFSRGTAIYRLGADGWRRQRRRVVEVV